MQSSWATCSTKRRRRLMIAQTVSSAWREDALPLALDFWGALGKSMPLTEEADLNSVRLLDTARHEALVEASLSKTQRFVVVAALPGSKTMTCDHALASNQAALYARAALACAAGTKASDVARLLSEHCELRGAR